MRLEARPLATFARIGALLPRLLLWAFWFSAFAASAYRSSTKYQREIGVIAPQWRTAAIALSAALLTMLLFAVGVALARTHPIRRGQIWRSLRVHVVAGAMLWPAFAILDYVTRLSGVHMRGENIPWQTDLAATVVSFVVWVALVQGVRWIWDAGRSERMTLKLRAELSEAARQHMEAELRAFRSEVSPRFLIDAFETLSNQIAGEPERAERTVGHLGDVLRSALHRGPTREVTLYEELDGLQPVVELERARLGGRLRVDFHAEDGLLDALVPDMMLQPLVTVVLRGPCADGTEPCLAIAAHRAGDSLEISVTGSGVVRNADATALEERDQSTLATMRARLAALYGHAARLELLRTSEDVWTGRLSLPWHEVEIESAAPENRVAPKMTWGHRFLDAAALLSCVVLSWLDFWKGDVDAMARRHQHLPPLFLSLASLFTSVIFALTVLVALEMARRYPWSDDALSSSRRWFLHARAAVGLGMIHATEKAAMSLPWGTVTTVTVRHLAPLAVGAVAAAIMFYSGVIVLELMIGGAVRRIRAYRDSLRIKVAMNETNRRRAEAELRALQAELNPHLLGNALHTVAGLIRVAPGEAARLLQQLQQLLRAPMTKSGTHEVSLAEELALLEPYLAVESARIRRPLNVRWSVEKEALSGRVPRMILQPLLENAVKHGLANQPSGDTGGIEVCARRVGEEGEKLEVTVCEEGAGLAHASVLRRTRPVGVANTRARLRELYGERARFELMARPGGGTIARLSLPWHEEPMSPVAAAASYPSYREPNAMTLA
jgi:LytS/YehU family sensor histidine kinase